MHPFQPAPKPQRVRNPGALREVVHLRDGRCMVGLYTPGKYGACSGGLDAHHIDFRGSGGNDTVENLITLCRYHHGLAQSRRILPEELRDILKSYYGYH